MSSGSLPQGLESFANHLENEYGGDVHFYGEGKDWSVYEAGKSFDLNAIIFLDHLCAKHGVKRYHFNMAVMENIDPDTQNRSRDVKGRFLQRITFTSEPDVADYEIVLKWNKAGWCSELKWL